MPKRNLISVMSYASVGLLGLLVLAGMCPAVSGESFATCVDGMETEGCTVSRAETETEVKVKTNLSLAVGNKVAMEVTPKSTGGTSIESTRLAVATNSTEGYALYMQASDGLVNASTMNDDAEINKISIIKQAATLAEMSNNSYGYFLAKDAADETTKFKALPTTNSMIERTSSTTVNLPGSDYAYGDNYALSFGVKVGTELPAGTYSGSVVVSAVANPETVRSMADLEYMQDMTSDVCARTREGYTKQLIDARDNRMYWVTKMKDGNCWMTQNLAFTITQEMIDNGSINAGNTDIAYTWGNTPAWTDEESWKALGGGYTAENYPGEYAAPSVTSSSLPGIVASEVTVKSTHSWNLGEVVNAYPDKMAQCYSHCKEVFSNVSEAGWQPTYTAQNGEWILDSGETYIGLATVDKNAKTYDAHYLVGNYYEFNAAVAGTGGNLESGDAAGSVCPKGWKIPLSGNNLSSGSLKYVFDSYGLTGNLLANEEYSLISNPFHIPRTGFLHVSPETNGAGLALAGNNGYMRSATVVSGASKGLDFVTTKAVSDSMGKMGGFPVRCLAR